MGVLSIMMYHSATYLPYAAVLVFIFVLLRRRKQVLPLPPGPPADPIIGHLRKLPPVHHHGIFQKWAAEYGDMFYLNVLGQSMLVVNTFQIATDLLEKRSANYSDRPKSVSLGLLGFDSSLALMEYGPRWRKHRQMVQAYFNAKKCRDYYQLHIREVHVLMKNLLSQPKGFDWAIQRFATANIIEITYGHRVLTDDDEYVKIGKAALDSLEAGNIGASPVDFFPFLRFVPPWVPGCSHLTGPIRKYQPAVRRLHDFPFQVVENEMITGTALPSFTSTYLDKIEREGPNNEKELSDIKAAAASLYIGGVETMSSTLRTFVLAMLLSPEVQRKAQKEIDRVVGTDRFPDFSDRASTPYLDCVLQETLRWHAAVPLGAPHRSAEDDVYNEMLIPKGTYVITNLTAMHREFYRDADKFYPDRFLPEPIGYGEIHHVAAFGFGRRRCPGVDFALNTMWIMFATFLATFDVTYAVGEDGKKIIPKAAFTPHLTSAPEPFECAITPRSAKAVALVRQQIAD
ncbi:cytochrome P450 [Sparassis crispa]|uniref:Cytochrome P450 n=1 Tax=Sparassis crispa TaxID=139825 RepID=A0A401GEI3_9APHY|nr:cytochrome P450 [Sparassis crispa]GBE80604.1 cytochrome P450 [Sparassis crispa]